MKRLVQYICLAALTLSPMLLAGCSTQGVQDARQSALERRQNRMDSRTAARQERWRLRGEREDARARAQFDSW